MQSTSYYDTLISEMKWMSKDELLKFLTDEVKSAGSQQALAKQLDVSNAYLSDVLNSRREPGQKILNPLNLHATTIYHRKGKK